MDVEEAVALVYLLKRRKRRNRKLWVHPFLTVRSKEGLFTTFYSDLRMCENKFSNYLRMSTKSFDELFEALQTSLTGTDTNMRRCVTPEEKLVITLRYLAIGCSFSDLHQEFRLGISTVTGIVLQVCKMVWLKMKETCMPLPSKEEWIQIADGFEKNVNFPNCIGVIYGKHIRIIKPYRKFFSVVLLAVCDSNYRFIAVDVGAHDNDSDYEAIQDSEFYKRLSNKSLDIPDRSPISKEEGAKPVPFVMAGDSAFGLTENIMRPFGGRSLNLAKKTFNYRLSRAHRYAESTFGILFNKWRIFYRPLNVKTEFAEDIIKASCILHNFVIARDGYDFEDTLTVPTAVENLEAANIRPTSAALLIREQYLQYFTNEGQVEWQNQRIE